MRKIFGKFFNAPKLITFNVEWEAATRQEKSRVGIALRGSVHVLKTVLLGKGNECLFPRVGTDKVFHAKIFRKAFIVDATIFFEVF